MGAEPKQLHVTIFPFLASGHMIPALDIAKLFTFRNVVTTIITTPKNAPYLTSKVTKQNQSMINIEVFRFPSEEVGLPRGFENIEQAIAGGMMEKILDAAELLKDQLEQYLDKTRPDCLIADMFFPWATDCAAKFNIPRLVFHGTSYTALCAEDIMRQYEPYKNVSSDDEPFALPLLPHELKMTRLQIPETRWKYIDEKAIGRTKRVKESEVKSYGVIVNSFYELEPDYAEFYRKELGRRAWSIGPVSLCNRSVQDKAQRGKQSSIDEHECLKWLDSKKPNTVIYICFGSTAPQSASQLYEIAMALESSKHDFIWVVRKSSNEGKTDDNDWLLPTGFEQRTQGKGLIIRGWAPQMLILEHEAIGAFVTHCGWNSTLEGISAGVPMVTWPIFAEQFYNEKLVNQILKIGVAVGAKKWIKTASDSQQYMVKRDDIEKALKEIMVGDEAEERRKRAKKLREMAWNAVEEGGSSYSDLTDLLHELRNLSHFKDNHIV